MKDEAGFKIFGITQFTNDLCIERRLFYPIGKAVSLAAVVLMVDTFAKSLPLILW